MEKPVLVIMAAGMGSRYGGLKQIDPVDPYGNIIIDFSIYDALRAGFEEIVFLIKHEIEAEFRAAIGDRLSKRIKVTYAFQELSMVPEGTEIPQGRVKPLGPTHAVLCTRDAVKGRAFGVINSDDYYGPEAFRILYDFLTREHGAYAHAAVGYPVENTLTDNGAVTRGVCVVKEDGRLTAIRERTGIIKAPGGAAWQGENGAVVPIPAGTTVSMNCWAFQNSIYASLSARFARQLAPGLARNPQKYEDLLPEAVCEALYDGKTTVTVIPTHDAWFGVTYHQDKPAVMEKIAARKAAGLYPETLWE